MFWFWILQFMMIITKQLILISLNKIYSDIMYIDEEKSLIQCAYNCVETGNCTILFYFKTKKKCLIYTEHPVNGNLIYSEGWDVYRLNQLPVCSLGWTMFSDTCYKLFKEDVAQEIALKKCRAHKASLVNVHSATENKFLRSYLGDPQAHWLGGRYHSKEKQWRWTDGSKISLDLWIKNRPINESSAACMVQTDLNWVDVTCSEEIPYLCEKAPE